MSPKTTRILYWVFTILFAGLMIFSSIGGLQPSEQGKQLMHDYLGYPIYFIQLISWAKIVGSVVLLIPGLNKIKEWAYAGLFFDLAAAIYSAIAVAKAIDPLMLTMLAWIIPGVLSYIYWNRLKRIAVATLRIESATP